MDSINLRASPADMQPNQQQQQPPMYINDGGDGGGGDGGDWRLALPIESRHKIVNKIMDTLKRHLPFSGQEGYQELKKIAMRFEARIFSEAISQDDYLRKISMKMLTMETKSQGQNQNANSTPSNSVGNGRIPQDSASQNMQSQVQNQGQSIPMPMAPNQAQGQQPIIPQNIQNNIVSAGVQSFAGNQSTPSSMNSLKQTQMPNAAGQSLNVHNMANASQNVIGNSIGQAVPSTVYVNAQRQMQGRQQTTPQQQHSQNSQYPFQQQLLTPKVQQGSMQNSNMQSHTQQPQQQHLIHSNLLHPSQQSVMQTPSTLQLSGMQSAPLYALTQNQQAAQSILQQHPQSALRAQQPQQSPVVHQQQTPMMQRPMLSSQQQPNATNLQQNQMLGKQTSMTDMQQQRMLSQPNNLRNLQHQPQIMAPQNNQPNIHQSQVGSQNNPTGSQQPQFPETQSGSPSMQTSQQSLHIQQQTHQNVSNLVTTPGQHQQPQQMMAHMQSQLPQQSGQQQQQQNPSHLDIAQKLQMSNAMLQPHNMTDQQKQLYQTQRNLPEASSTSLDSTAETGNVNGGDWQEEVHQKIRTMKDLYLRDVMEMYQRLVAKLKQHDSLPRQPNMDQQQHEKMKSIKTFLEHILTLLQLPKKNVAPNLKEKLGAYEKQIIYFLNSHRPKKPNPLTQQRQFSPSQIHSMQQSQQGQSQNIQLQSHENQVNPQLQAMNLQGREATMQQTNSSDMQHGSMPFPSMAPNPQQNMMCSLQSGSNLNPGQGNILGSLQPNPVGTLNQTTMNAHSSQGGVSMSHPGINGLQSNLNIQQQQLMRAKQRQMMHKQHILQQQLHQQTKQQPMQSPSHSMAQHLVASQHTLYPQQPKSDGSFPTSSPRILQASSPLIHQHSLPQADQQNMFSSLTKAGTPTQSLAHSPFMVPSPQTPVTRSPMLGDPDKHAVGISSLTNSGQQGNNALPPAQSLAIGTPGISASPLLAEFASQDSNRGNALTSISGKSSITEQPIDRLIRAVRSVSSKAMISSASDMGSVVSMVDRIVGSAPGNGSRATVGEDLVAMTKCRLQARNFITQDGSTGTKRMRRYTNGMPLVAVSSGGSVNDNSKQLADAETSDIESTASSNAKRPRIEVNHVLLDEIKEINQRLIDTTVDVSDEDADQTAATAEGGKGTIVKCTYIAVALCPSLKLKYSQMSPIHPLRLLVPENYPSCSPVVLENFPVEIGKGHEDFSAKARSKLSRSLRCLSQPMSLREIAKTWDACARAVLCEYAQQSGGGTFSSVYGAWENVVAS